MNVVGHLLRLPLLALVACVHLPRVAPEIRTSTNRTLSAVRVEVACGSWSSRSGSGVIISDRHVLTTAHLVSCVSLPRVRVTYTDGNREHRLNMVVTEEDRSSGIAKLEIASAESFGLQIRPPVLRLPDPGNGVCASTAGDGGGLPCGVVASTWTVVKRMATKPGDAGAPVYCDQGTLVGLVAGTGESSDTPYTWIAPIESHWLDGIVPAAAARPSLAVRMPEGDRWFAAN